MVKDIFKKELLRFLEFKFDDADLKAAYYRWEALRENHLFKNDFRNFKSKFDDADLKQFIRKHLNFSDDFDDFEKYLEEEIQKEEIKEEIKLLPSESEFSFYKKWMLGVSFAALSSYGLELKDTSDDFYSKFVNNKVFRTDREKILASQWAKTVFITGVLYQAGPIDDTMQFVFTDYGERKFLTGEKEIASGKLSIKVDLNYSKNIIKREFEKRLDYWKAVFDSNHKAQDRLKELSPRKRFKNYDKYFKVWRLRNQFPKPTFEEIGRITYPKKFQESQDSQEYEKAKKQAKDLAIQNYYAAYKLIYGKKYSPEEIIKEIKPEDLTKICSNCQDREKCKYPCQAVMAYISQDEVKGERELPVPNIKYAK